MKTQSNQKRLADLKRMQFLVRQLGSESSFLCRLPFKLFLVVGSLLIIWSMCNAIMAFDLPPIAYALLMLLVAVAIFLIFRKLPSTWEEVLAAMLLSYYPVNVDAFESLRQAHVNMDRLQLSVIREWLTIEGQSVVADMEKPNEQR